MFSPQSWRRVHATDGHTEDGGAQWTSRDQGGAGQTGGCLLQQTPLPHHAKLRSVLSRGTLDYHVIFTVIAVLC